MYVTDKGYEDDMIDLKSVCCYASAACYNGFAPQMPITGMVQFDGGSKNNSRKILPILKQFAY